MSDTYFNPSAVEKRETAEHLLRMAEAIAIIPAEPPQTKVRL